MKTLTLEELEWRVVHNAGNGQKWQRYRWSWVKKATGLGSTAAKEMCRRHGLDPDELVPALEAAERLGDG